MGLKYAESWPRWWIASNRNPNSMSPRGASQATVPSMRKRAFLSHAASSSPARRFSRSSAFFSYAATDQLARIPKLAGEQPYEIGSGARPRVRLVRGFAGGNGLDDPHEFWPL